MITVRYPSGFSVQYNDAVYLTYQNHGWELYTDQKKTKWIASIQNSAGVIIESVRPWATYDANTVDDQKLIQLVMDRLPKMSQSKVRGLKRHLKNYNSNTGSWTK